jgi:hypothetical protein
MAGPAAPASITHQAQASGDWLGLGPIPGRAFGRRFNVYMKEGTLIWARHRPLVCAHGSTSFGFSIYPFRWRECSLARAQRPHLFRAGRPGWGRVAQAASRPLRFRRRSRAAGPRDDWLAPLETIEVAQCRADLEFDPIGSLYGRAGTGPTIRMSIEVVPSVGMLCLRGPSASSLRRRRERRADARGESEHGKYTTNTRDGQ